MATVEMAPVDLERAIVRPDRRAKIAAVGIATVASVLRAKAATVGLREPRATATKGPRATAATDSSTTTRAPVVVATGAVAARTVTVR